MFAIRINAVYYIVRYKKIDRQINVSLTLKQQPSKCLEDRETKMWYIIYICVCACLQLCRQPHVRVGYSSRYCLLFSLEFQLEYIRQETRQDRVYKASKDIATIPTPKSFSIHPYLLLVSHFCFRSYRLTLFKNRHTPLVKC